MSITLDGTAGVVVSGNTNTLSGITVGRGAGSVASNTAVGASALNANTSSGIRNTAVGYNAMISNTDGTRNTAVGYTAMNTNTTGSYNAAFGVEAFYSNTTGSGNTSVGWNSLNLNTTGNNNTAIGVSALSSNTTSNYNVAVGQQALSSNTVGGYSTAVGYQALYTSNHTSDVFSINTAVGYQAGYSVTTGSINNFIGYNAGYFVTTGTKNTILGAYNGNQGGLDIRTASNFIVISDGDGNPVIYTVGTGGLNEFRVPSVYTLTTANAANMYVFADGSIRRSTSARKYKQDIRDVEDFDISALRPVRYKSKGEKDDQAKDHLGLIADEAAEAGFDELVTRGADGEIEGFQYERLTVVLLKKLQVLEAEVKALKGQA